VAGARVGVKWRNNAQFAQVHLLSPCSRGSGGPVRPASSFFHPDRDIVPAASRPRDAPQSDVNAMQISTGRSDRDRDSTPPRSPSSTLRCRYAIGAAGATATRLPADAIIGVRPRRRGGCTERRGNSERDVRARNREFDGRRDELNRGRDNDDALLAEKPSPPPRGFLSFVSKRRLTLPDFLPSRRRMAHDTSRRRCHGTDLKEFLRQARGGGRVRSERDEFLNS